MTRTAGRGMTRTATRGAAVIGSGPNGLAAAITLARAGVPVTVFESAPTPGGGMRTGELVAPGLLHDMCSAIHPMALASEFFRRFELDRRMDFVIPEASYAHPLDGGARSGGHEAAIAYRSLDRTAAELGRDGAAFRALIRPLLDRVDRVQDFAMGGGMLRFPKSPLTAAMVGLRGLEQGSGAWNLRFREDAAPALLTGALAHGITRLPSLAAAGVGLVLATHAHARGWAVPVGGSQRIAEVMLDDLAAHGGTLVTDTRIGDLAELRDHGDFDTVIASTSAHGLAEIGRRQLPAGYRRKLTRVRPGPGICKVDFELDGPVPWRDERVALAPTVHLGGLRAEIAASETAVTRGRRSDRPFVLLAQPDGWDRTRNPEGRVAIWSYAHVPTGSTRDESEAVIAQIERFAPGFRDRIVAMRVTTADEMSRYNANYVGGDISAGGVTLPQLLARPTAGPSPWRTPLPGLYFASASVSPGPGVHGLAGWYAAKDALRLNYGLQDPELSIDSGSRQGSLDG